MGASANGLADFSREAVGDAERGLDTVTSLRTASGQIRHAVDLINQVASQTRLLALNATIEGLSQLADVLRSEVHRFVSTARQG